MSDILEYKGYEGTIAYSKDDECLVGKILHINGSIAYAGDSVPEIKQMFEQAVDEYLEMCAELGIAPEKPYKGSLNVRIGPHLHSKLARKSIQENTTINALICIAIDDYLTTSIQPQLHKKMQFMFLNMWESLENNLVEKKSIQINMPSVDSEFSKEFYNVQ